MYRLTAIDNNVNNIIDDGITPVHIINNVHIPNAPIKALEYI
jgi:hypothetical protein